MITMKISHSDAQKLLAELIETKYHQVEIQIEDRAVPSSVNPPSKPKLLDNSYEEGFKNSLKAMIKHIPREHKIALIRLIRAGFNIGLAECKNFVEEAGCR